MTDIEKYQSELDKLIAEDATAIFGNYTQDHAVCIFRTFIRNAKHSILLLTGDFAQGIFLMPDIRSALLSAIQRGVTLRVISLNPGTQEEMERFRTLIVPSSAGSYDYVIGRVREGVTVHHYLVVDGKAYRYEAPHQEMHPMQVHAEVCCNGVEGASVLARRFESLWLRLHV